MDGTYGVSHYLDIHDRRSINVMLAHIERYLSYNNKWLLNYSQTWNSYAS